MSRLDQHVAGVQNKLALGRFVNALAWTTLIVAGAVLVAIAIDKIIVFGIDPKKVWISIASAAGAALVAAMAALAAGMLFMLKRQSGSGRLTAAQEMACAEPPLRAKGGE
jgi:hypothetical protein